MTDSMYKAVYYGKIIDGFHFDQVKQSFVKLFAVSEEKAEKILKSNKAVLKKMLKKKRLRNTGMPLQRPG